MNYEAYFSKDDVNAYIWDVGPMSLRNLVRREVGDATNVLEVGCGMNPVYPDSHTMDLQGDPTYRRDVSRTPPDACRARYDAVVMVHVLEHIPQDAAAVQHCYQMLRPGGLLVIVSPGHQSGVCTHKEFIANGHLRRMTLQYAYSLQTPTFRVVKYRSVHVLHDLLWNRLKYALKAFYYPAKMLDQREMYSRPSYRRIAPVIASILDTFDCRITRSRRSNALVVMEKMG